MGSTAMTLSQTIQKVPKCGQKTGLDGKSSCFTFFFFFPGCTTRAQLVCKFL